MEVKNLCAKIAIDLYRKVTDAKTEAGLTTNEYITQVLTEYYAWKENGGNVMAQNNENTRTMAFQISETLFQRIKAHLERESNRRGIRLTQKDFVLGLIEAALDEAEREAARSDETAAGQPGETDARPETDADAESLIEEDSETPDGADSAHANSGEDDGEPDADSGEGDAENAPADAVEDADSGDGSRSPEGN